ncbi:Cadherin C and Laminin G 2 and Cadherin domain co ntaining protein [Trichuris trichiura]|uniref:Cadherin C and Laminin G 2 and Cadherin domain co ntaining protein n=1 Tax=Trichuris trichiura TaxID=36087 RepID=A0A077Z8V8_TRITR|nr:Cadherin C and Laminin G 2 and Cadherin domain co ntaining protein [Trichuris trichiura]
MQRMVELSAQQIVVFVDDVYEKPKFVNKPVPFLAVVPLEVPVGFTVFNLEARCEGGDGPPSVEYHFISSEPANTFTVDRFTGRIKTAMPRYISGRSYRVFVQAFDSRPGLISNGYSEIAVVDIMGGSRAPQFFQDSYQVSVYEDAPVSASIAQIKAVSFRNDPEVQIAYSLWEDSQSSVDRKTPNDFTIDERTGVLHLMKQLDYDNPVQPRSYKFKAVATEGEKSTSVPVDIGVLDVNDNDPVFTQPLYSASVKEDHPIGQPILQVLARDKDSDLNGRLSYSLSDKNFVINDNGVISPRVRLDADQNLQGFYIYKFVVTATDHGSPPRTATSQVHIRTENVNDEAPVFLPTSMYTEYVAEDAQGNTPIATIQALDPDRDQVNYYFLSSPGSRPTHVLGHFEIDKDTGQIKLREGIGPADLQQQDFYMLTVLATDNGPGEQHVSTATVRIGVKDVNNNKPVFNDCERYSSEAKVPEGKHENYVILTVAELTLLVGVVIFYIALQVEATDDDSGQNGDIIYSLYYPQGETRKPFVIDAVTGELRASPYVEFDREERPFEDVIVKATDKGSRPLIGFCQFTVTVLDENDNAPEFDRGTYEGSISRSTPIGRSVLTVFADDRDAPNNARISYQLQADPSEPDHADDVNYFSVKPDGGEIMLLRSLPVEKNRMMFLAIARDSGDPPRSTQVRVTIDIAEAAQHYPVWQVTPSCPNEVVVDEDVQINYVFFECHALSGADPTNPIYYSMRNGAKPDTNSNQDFREFQEKRNERDWVVVRNLKGLDYEKTKSYDLTISATDLRNGLSRDKVVRVRLRDKNDNVPKFTLDKFTGSVEEEQDVSTMRKRPLVTVVAKDNDERPEFKDITYKILPGPASHLFRIDSKSGAVYATQSFDREKNDSFVLDVQAEDNAPSDLPGARGPNRDITKVQILIQDINDNAPYFNESVYRGRVRENAEVGQNVMTVKAHDLDKDSELRYSLDSRGNDGSAFSVGATSGTIFINEPLDYERKKLYDLVLYVTDGNREHLAQARIQIAVEDVNDNAPQFDQPLYKAVIQEEDTNVPKKLLHVTAYDKDDDIASKRIVYKLAGQGANEEFTINEITGDLFVAKPLDRDPPNGAEVWNFVVQAIDDGGKGLIGYADVQVLLTDINDNAPFFKGSPFIGYVTENLVPKGWRDEVKILNFIPTKTIGFEDENGIYVMTLSATDNDDPKTLNAKLTYSILRNKYLNGRPVFRIDSQTGKLFAMMELDRENSAQKEFEIEIPFLGTGVAIIKVVDVNDNAPYFVPSSYEGTVKETAPINSPVLSVSAMDLDDEAVDNVLQYSLENGDQLGPTYFYISSDGDSSGSTVGILRVKQRLDYEDPLQRNGFNLTVRVSDGRFTSKADVYLRLLDENDNAPEFVDPPHMVSIREDAPVGRLVVWFRVRDKDAGDDQFDFRIQHESDQKRQFTIGNKDGNLKVARPLDREDIPQYRLRIEVVDSAMNVGDQTLVVNLIDVNDNAPELKYNKPVIVMENEPPARLLATVTAIDRDLPENGPPFYMEQASNSTYKDMFHMRFIQELDFGHGGLEVKATVKFDREDGQGKILYVPIYVRDNGTPPMHAIRFLEVVVGDKNDNPMTDGEAVIQVYRPQKLNKDVEIGRVYVQDLDDWDAKDKRFSLRGHSDNFRVGTHGKIHMTSNTPAGEYEIQADVHDTVRNEDAKGRVKIIVEEINQEALDNTASLRIQGVTAEDFVRPVDGVSSLDKFRRTLADALSIPEAFVQVYSIIDAGGHPPKLDLYFAVHGSGYKSPALLHGLLELNRYELESAMSDLGQKKQEILIVDVNLDPCALETCSHACSSFVNVGDSLIVVNGNRSVVAGLNASLSYKCECPVVPLSASCADNSCFNNGICHSTGSTFFCECRGQHTGERCAGHVRSFDGSGWAWFEPIKSCQRWNVSLEVLTQSNDGVILYNGPIVDLRPTVREMFVPDFLYVALKRGRLIVNAHFGGQPVSISSSSKSWIINDGHWHTIELFVDGRVLTVIVDKCVGENYVPMDDSSSDLNRCEVAKAASLDNDQLNTKFPLQIGGIAQAAGGYSYRRDLNTTTGLNGCVRNLFINGMIVDFSNPLKVQNSELGCRQVDHKCDSNSVEGSLSKCAHGECIADFHGFKCVCEPGWRGDECNVQSKWVTFGPSSFIRYLLSVGSLPGYYSKVNVLFYPETAKGTLFSASRMEKNHSMHLMLEDSVLNYLLSFAPDVTVKTRWPRLTLARNQSYHVDVERTKNIVRLVLDRQFRYVTTLEIRKHYKMEYDLGSFRVGSPSRVRLESGFMGCIQEVAFNEYWLPLIKEQETEYAKIDDHWDVKPGCDALLTCDSLPGYCSSPLVCVNFWKGPFCTCPPDTSHYYQDGQLRCSRPLAAKYVGITSGAVAAILITLLALIGKNVNHVPMTKLYAIVFLFLVLVLILVVYSRRRRRPVPLVGPDDDIRENIINYAEEGGGEEDQDTYNIAALRKPILPIEDDPVMRMPNGHLGDFIKDKLRDADRDPLVPPFDELRVYCNEEDAQSVGSLSSLSSTGSDIDWDEVRNWSEPMKRLADTFAD